MDEIWLDRKKRLNENSWVVLAENHPQNLDDFGFYFAKIRSDGAARDG